MSKYGPFAMATNAVEPWEPDVPNTMFDAPFVPVRQAVYLAYIKYTENGVEKEEWFGMRPRTKMLGKVMEWPERLKAVAVKCGTYQEGSFVIVSFDRPLSDNMEILRLLWNSYNPPPAGCKVADDGYSLIPV